MTWVLIDTADDDVPVILENTPPPENERALWRAASDDEYQRYYQHYNTFGDPEWVPDLTDPVTIERWLETT